jgi:hypothetical protein
MAIPAAQLETWSHQGAVKQSRDTYATVKGALEDPNAPYHGRRYTTFLQGSYGNDTNIWADSDVDVVMRLDSIFYADLEQLPEADKATWNAARSGADYDFKTWKVDVVAHLGKKFQGKVDPGNKAIFIRGEGNRRDADVLACVQLRKYTRFKSWNDSSYVDGICFWDKSGQWIKNYPRKHSENCTWKHKVTNSWFKPSVRILKNMRNRMIETGYLAEGVAPSYYLEGMLYNVPTEKFGGSYETTIVNALNWLSGEADRAKLLCANEQFYLLHPTSPVTWRAEKFQAYLHAAVKFWKEW